MFNEINCIPQNPTSTPVLYSRDSSPRIVNSYRNRIDTDYGKPPHTSYTYRTTPARRVYTPPTTTSTTTTTTTTTTPQPIRAATASIPRQKYASIVLYSNKNVCKLIYFLPLCKSSPHRYIWRTSRWSACSASCDGGYRMRSVRCVSESSNQVVDDRYCVDEKPVELANCAQQRCPKWRTGGWGQVSLTLKFPVIALLKPIERFETELIFGII